MKIFDLNLKHIFEFKVFDILFFKIEHYNQAIFMRMKMKAEHHTEIKKIKKRPNY